jgi:hypothetical protein
VFNFQGFFIFCVSKKYRFFPLSTTISDSKLTHSMTHSITGFQQALLVGNSNKNGIKNTRLTHGLTHTKTHVFVSHSPLEMSVLKRLLEESERKFFIHFFTVFYSKKNVCQNPAHNLTGVNHMACSLNPYFFTAKTAIL